MNLQSKYESLSFFTKKELHKEDDVLVNTGKLHIFLNELVQKFQTSSSLFVEISYYERDSRIAVHHIPGKIDIHQACLNGHIS